jgi:hypothetical protein
MPQEIQKMSEINAVLAQQKTEQPPSHLGHTLLTILFPPAGLYFAWKNGTLDHVLPKFVITYSALFFVLSLPMYGAPLTLKSFSDSYKNMSAPLIVCVTMLLAVCIVGVVMGYLHMRQVKKHHSISRSDKTFLFLLIFGIMVFNTLLSIYITTLTMNVIYSQFNNTISF